VNRYRSEAGTALIWFIALTVFVAFLALVIVSTIDQFLFARALTDFAEQFAIASKTQLLSEPSQNLKSISSALWAQIANDDYWVGSVSLESGKTVKVVLCGYWNSPVELISATRRICEVALAR
jgi:hypothetical protein